MVKNKERNKKPKIITCQPFYLKLNHLNAKHAAITNSELVQTNVQAGSEGSIHSVSVPLPLVQGIRK